MNKKAIILFFPIVKDVGIHLVFPVALLHLERMVRHLDIEIILLDEQLNRNYTDIIRQTQGRLLFAGVSAVVGPQVKNGVKFSETVKSITGAPIIWGGWFATAYPKLVLNDGYADYVCIGQGELPFKAFTERMLSSEDISDIPGIGYKKNGQTFVNSNLGLVNPNSFPLIDRTLIDLNSLIDLNGKVAPEFRVLFYTASYGCPHKCNYCSSAHIFQQKWYAKKKSEVIDDLKYYKEKASISQVIFWDDNFFTNKKFSLEFCNELISSGLSLTWTAQSQVHNFLKNYSDEDIQLMYKAGCRRLMIGAESGDQETLDMLNKKTRVEENLEMVRLCKKHNIRTRLHFMICFPPDPDKDFWATMNIVGRAVLIDRAVEVGIKFFKPIAGTTIYQLCLDNGFVDPLTTNELIDSFPNKTDPPWYKRNYRKERDNFVNFYFLFASPFYFMTFPLKYRPIMLLLSLFLYPIVFIRFKLNWMKFPIEARILRKIIPSAKEITFLDTKSFNKAKYSKIVAED
ncbi:MAG: hypothetical protein A2X08_02015 [Bacteroidetes bacterium GWA2_32_17]|nr:MAG: hypothetical protein A2X08_02015 [Bacteroidetes bacterium GWA2_32_17]